tara:strand:- start:306 stop:572 length:267 start_codon:yes stop_codon:yes gene_type:complete
LKRSIGRLESVLTLSSPRDIWEEPLLVSEVEVNPKRRPTTFSVNCLGRDRAAQGWYFSSGFFFEPEGAAKHAFCAVCDVVSAINRGFS